jgi:hypothetical protein
MLKLAANRTRPASRASHRSAFTFSNSLIVKLLDCCRDCSVSFPQLHQRTATGPYRDSRRWSQINRPALRVLFQDRAAEPAIRSSFDLLVGYPRSSAVDGPVGIQAKPLKMLDSRFADRGTATGPIRRKIITNRNLCLKPQPPA